VFCCVNDCVPGGNWLLVFVQHYNKSYICIIHKFPTVSTETHFPWICSLYFSVISIAYLDLDYLEYPSLPNKSWHPMTSDTPYLKLQLWWYTTGTDNNRNISDKFCLFKIRKRLNPEGLRLLYKGTLVMAKTFVKCQRNRNNKTVSVWIANCEDSAIGQ